MHQRGHSNQDDHDRQPVKENHGEFRLEKTVQFDIPTEYERGNQEEENLIREMNMVNKNTMKYQHVRPRYMDMSRSTNYVRNRNVQIQRRRELERINNARTFERMEESRAIHQLKNEKDQVYRRWLQETNAEEQRLRSLNSHIKSNNIKH